MDMIASTVSTIARNEVAPLARANNAYADVISNLPDEPLFKPRGDTPMLRLPMVTVATIRHEPIRRPILPATRGLVSEATMRLVVLDAEGTRSAWSIAEEFQSIYFGGRTHGFTRGVEVYKRVPRKGFDLLRGIDNLGLIPLYCDVEDEHDWRRYKTVRLSEAIARLTSRKRE